jgi:hypothetical protein
MLAYFLKPGGALVVVDIIKDGYLHSRYKTMLPADAHHIIAHQHGFDESDMRKVFESAGLSLSFDAETLRQGEGGDDGDLFIAKGIKL